MRPPSTHRPSKGSVFANGGWVKPKGVMFERKNIEALLNGEDDCELTYEIRSVELDVREALAVFEPVSGWRIGMMPKGWTQSRPDLVGHVGKMQLYSKYGWLLARIKVPGIEREEPIDY